MNLTPNQQKIIDISKQLGLSHIGSNLSCLPVLEEIYRKKKTGDIVILDNGHAGLSHLIVRHAEMYKNNNEFAIDKDWVEKSIQLFGIHCDRQAGCDASGGSLGHGLGIAIGYALADRDRKVYVIVSDGSLQEGSEWEALRIINDLKIDNIEIHANLNSYTAVAKIDAGVLIDRIMAFNPYVTIHLTDNILPELEGLEGHYKILE